MQRGRQMTEPDFLHREDRRDGRPLVFILSDEMLDELVMVCLYEGGVEEQCAIEDYRGDRRASARCSRGRVLLLLLFFRFLRLLRFG